MSSSVTRRRQSSRTLRPSQGSGFRRPIIWSVLIATTACSIAAAAYFGLRKDDTQQMAGMQASYEKRIADLRAEFDRTTNQQVLEQKRIQEQVEVLLQRQVTLEQHKSTISDDQLATGSISAKEPVAIGLASVPPAAEPPRAPAVAKSASVRHRHRLRAQRRPAARPQQNGAAQVPPPTAQVDLSHRSYAPE